MRQNSGFLKSIMLNSVQQMFLERLPWKRLCDALLCMETKNVVISYNVRHKTFPESVLSGLCSLE